MTTPTWNGLEIDAAKLKDGDGAPGYGYTDPITTDGGYEGPRLLAYMAAGLEEMDYRIENSGAALVATSVTSNTIGTGTKSFVIETGKGFALNQWVLAYSYADPTKYLNGRVSAVNADAGTISLLIASGGTGGSGSVIDWELTLSGSVGATGASTTGSNSIDITGNVATVKKPTIYAADHTLVVGERVIMDCRAAAYTATLPASPAAMDWCWVRKIGSYTLTFARNGSKINTLSEDAYDVGPGPIDYEPNYIDSTDGWDI